MNLESNCCASRRDLNAPNPPPLPKTAEKGAEKGGKKGEEKTLRKIAIYGKGGIGKSTTVSNLSAALARRGLRVMQIGCDPKADSTKTLTGGRPIPSVLDVLQVKKKGESRLEDFVFEGYHGIFCVEAGGPQPGIGCAGRAIITAFNRLEELDAYTKLKPDVILFDVLGDVVCGGFAMPMRYGYADEIAIVSSGEMMALYAAHNIAKALDNFSSRGYARLAGIIQNSRNIANEDALVRQAAEELKTGVIGIIPRSDLVQEAENLGKTVVECFPDSPQAALYAELSRFFCPDSAQKALGE